MKRIFVTEPIHEDGMNLLRSEAEVILGSATDEMTIINEAANCDAILVRSANITESIIQNIPTLKVIAKHGVGVDNIDKRAAKQNGVMVVNAPESNINSVAEHGFAMILALSKNLVVMDKNTRNGDWGSRSRVISMEMKGKTIGMIGLGKISKAVIKKLHALDVNILGYDPYVDQSVADKHGFKLVTDINEIFVESDVVSLHIPLTDETTGLVGTEELKMMKESACLINVSRGGIVDENALYNALKNNTIRGAALDVFEQEPAAKENPLFELDNIIVSPHNAALTSEALLAMATHAAQGILDVLNNEKPKYRVEL
ncbi:hydroxyacid dehydrogenase [Alkalibacter mobilis]|uniref:hydroxyacid dehydrogenase n=1 Tax=Alkalibacter mobilis TaxID=2787712 RepID=UPI00189D0676|nr:hydroxyacid dehydrogenase [Alkalibacter mobilis]MBF7096738.1 hydroxyacid dehydrogenase [Alkalibacter mobilis]